MEFRRVGGHYVVRIDRGEELVEALEKFCEESGVELALVFGIGAMDHAVVGLFDVESKEFHKKTLTGPHEITSVLGNITVKDGKTYLHLHVNLADSNHNVFGGHLVSARISATFEAVVLVLDGKVTRKFDAGLGLNLLDFSS